MSFFSKSKIGVTAATKMAADDAIRKLERHLMVDNVSGATFPINPSQGNATRQQMPFPDSTEVRLVRGTFGGWAALRSNDMTLRHDAAFFSNGEDLIKWLEKNVIGYHSNSTKENSNVP